MAWGNYWNPVTKKTEEFKPIKGQQYDINENQIGSQSYWKLKNNPMYKAAADALGVDWDQFIADADASVGLEADWSGHPEWKEPLSHQEQMLSNAWGGAFAEDDSPGYNVNAYNEAYEEWSNDEDSDIFSRPEKSDFPEFEPVNQYGFSGNKDIFNQIKEFDTWLTDTSKFQSQYDIIREGPKAEQYGMEGDNIFAAIGIDKAPEAPKELDVSYEMNLAEAKTSNVKYETPFEYTEVNLHADD